MTSLMSELSELDRKFGAGEFKNIETTLECFIRQHKNEIKDFKTTKLPLIKEIPPTDALAVKLYIMQTRSINPLEEIKLELDEIEKEIWYQSEKTKGPVNREEITKEWCKNHAPGWRDHWIMTVIYVFERSKERFIKLLE